MSDETLSDAGLRYDRMVEDALRSVVRRSLEFVVAQGLPGNHHFYITFRTEHPQVAIPASLKERYPVEMTIVLQNQFWDLQLDDETFSVTLSFNDIHEQLTVPFAAVVAFADPSVRFGLQFEGDQDDEEAEAEEGDSAAQGDKPKAVKLEVVSGGDEAAASDEQTQDNAPADDEAGEDGDKKSGPGKVITLDTFRKK